MNKGLKLTFLFFLLAGISFLALSAPSQKVDAQVAHSAAPVLNETETGIADSPATINTEELAGNVQIPVAHEAAAPFSKQEEAISPLFPPIPAEISDQALTLNECYALALKQSETIAIDAEKIREAEAHFMESLGSILPQTSFVWSRTNQDSGRAFSSWNNNATFESKFVFKQTLFSGFKEFAAMAGSKLEKEQRVYEKQRAEHLLFVDVADAFYLLLEQQEDLRTLETIRAALQDRIAELKKREEIGRSRHSEVVNTESQVYNIEAEIELVKSQEQIARELLSFLTGEKVADVVDVDDTPESLLDEVNYTAKSDLRPDVKAAQYAWGVTKKEAVVARSDLFPTVSLEGNYYKHRSTAPRDDTWSTLLKMDVPIFEGTTTFGAIKAANTAARISELEMKRTQRLAEQDIHDSYVRARTGIIRAGVLDKAFKSAEENYFLQKQDYRYSLVSNLEVLAAIQNLGTVRRSYIQALYDKKRFYWELKAAIGEVLEVTP